LIPGIFANLELNRKHFESFRLFEIGREIHRAEGKPREVLHLAAAVYPHDDTGALYELKRIAQAVAPGICVAPASETLAYEHPARTADLLLEGSKAGRLFEAHPRMVEGRAAILDINLDQVFEARKPLAQFKPIGRFPSSAFDLTIVVAPRVRSSQIENSVREFAGPLLERVEYVRQYEGTDGTKSLTYRMTVGAPDRTLSSAEINAVRAHIIDKLQEQGYELKV
jgi:phenylalanyl-tRNA synthetase beta chain